jgi:hypothetical protein
MTAPGLYTSPLNSTPSSEILVKPSLLPYPSLDSSNSPAFDRALSAASPAAPPVPVSIAVTQWHWLLLYPDRIVGVARESEKVVWNEALPLVSGSWQSVRPEPTACRHSTNELSVYRRTQYRRHSGSIRIDQFSRCLSEMKIVMFGGRSWIMATSPRHCGLLGFALHLIARRPLN